MLDVPPSAIKACSPRSVALAPGSSVAAGLSGTHLGKHEWCVLTLIEEMFNEKMLQTM